MKYRNIRIRLTHIAGVGLVEISNLDQSHACDLGLADGEHRSCCVCCRPASPSPRQVSVEREPPEYVPEPVPDPAHDPRQFDSTGMFHWCPEVPLSQASVVSEPKVI